MNTTEVILAPATSIANSFDFSNGIDGVALLVFSVIVFVQQSGFASLEAGGVQAKNVYNILLDNIVDKLICSLCWFVLGFGFAYGQSFHGFVGSSHFALTGMTIEAGLLWFFSLNFLLTSCTIVSGALAERARVEAYVAYAAVMSLVIFPFTQHWTQTWLATKFSCRYLDFAGGSTVHLIGGVAALVGCIIIKPRTGRFNSDGTTAVFRGHNIVLVATGSLQLWLGWYGFNIAPAFLQGDNRTMVAVRAAVNTTLSICGSSLTTLALLYWRTQGLDLRYTCNGILGGAVAITALAAYVEPWYAFVIGVLGGIVYVYGVDLVEWFRIDDPLEASVVHGLCSLVGLLGAGVFASAAYVEESRPAPSGICSGFAHGGNGMQLGVQLLGIIVITMLAGVVSLVLFSALQWCGYLRVERNWEIAGLDRMENAPPAYPDFVLVNGPSCVPEGAASAPNHTPHLAPPVQLGVLI
eukprot:jgi/Botrbrau1/14908/Bobra.0018s0013.1